jgi:hypothetical protein
MARRGSLRASDADRERIVDRLRSAAAEGRLAAHELEHRVGAALGARTYGELDATVADLPSASPARRPGAVATVREHPLLLVALIPVVLIVVALFAAITIASLALAAVLFILGRRRGLYVGPRSFCGWCAGFGPYTRTGRREPGHWGHWA